MKHQIFLNSRRLKPSKVLAQEAGFKKFFSSVETVDHKQEITCCWLKPDVICNHPRISFSTREPTAALLGFFSWSVVNTQNFYITWWTWKCIHPLNFELDGRNKSLEWRVVHAKRFVANSLFPFTGLRRLATTARLVSPDYSAHVHYPRALGMLQGRILNTLAWLQGTICRI